MGENQGKTLQPNIGLKMRKRLDQPRANKTLMNRRRFLPSIHE